jgi:hypothetical protein
MSEILHELLDISLNTPRDVADVFFTLSAHVNLVTIDIHPGGWKSRSAGSPALSVNASYVGENAQASQERTLSRVKAFLAPENIEAEKKTLKAANIEKLRAELAAAEEGALA